jgi:hypothetical protein
MEEQSRSNSGKKEDPLNVCFAELPGEYFNVVGRSSGVVIQFKK